MEINQAVNDWIGKDIPDRGSIPRESTIVNWRTAMETYGVIFAVILLIGLLVLFYKNT